MSRVDPARRGGGLGGEQQAARALTVSLRRARHRQSRERTDMLGATTQTFGRGELTFGARRASRRARAA